MKVTIPFDVPIEVAFDYLVDPANRPEWQSSLRSVEFVGDSTPALGQQWIDVTSPGLRPAMETTAFERPHRWTERGTWGSITAELTLTFERGTGPNPGCLVHAEASVQGRGLTKPLGPILTGGARFAIPGDLRRAGAIIAARHRAGA